MPYQTNGRRNYKKEYQLYHSRDEQKKNRAKRNGARSMMAKAGKVSKGDGKDVAHKTALSKGGLNQMYNLMVQSKSENRSFKKDKNSKMVSEKSKRERRK